MLIKTHVAFGALFALAYISIFHPNNQILFFLLTMFGAMLPDIDHPKSTLGRYVKPIGKIFKHRGVFHSVFALPVFALLLFWLLDTSRFTFAILLGYVSHLLGDALSKEGIKPLTPFSNWSLRFALFRVGSAFEVVLLLLIVAADIWLLLRV